METKLGFKRVWKKSARTKSVEEVVFRPFLVRNIRLGLTLDCACKLKNKYPGGVERQKRLLEKERHIINRGKGLFVENYEIPCQKCDVASV